MKEIIKFKLLSDKPIDVNSSDLFNFYHDKFAPNLKRILECENTVHTIGLFGSWGTGKSTIIDLLKNEKDLKLKIFVFDAWKYQEDALRRIFLIKFVDFLIKEKFKIKKEIILNPLYSATTTEKVIKDETTTGWERFREYINKHGIIILVILIYIFLNLLIPEIKQNPTLLEIDIINNIVHLFDNINFGSGIGLFFITLYTLFIPLGPLISSKIAEILSSEIIKWISPYNNKRKIIETRQHLNSPEEFEGLFKNILLEIGLTNKQRIVVVFDNIDRVQGDIAISMLSTIKTFLEPNKNNNVVFLIPCDAESINQQIKGFYKDIAENPDFEAPEYLRKLFNLTIWLPEFINTDLEKYTEELIKSTGEISEILDDEDVLNVINSAFYKNPRQIKQFVNNLVANMIIALNSEVGEIIKKNPAYYAKTLVIKQNFPNAYKELKGKWYNPESIYTLQEGPEEIINFMRNTSDITVDDAQPFIYLKDSVVFAKLKNSHELRLNLVSGNKVESEDIINKEKDTKKLTEFIVELLKTYKSQKNILANIYKTVLEIFYEQKIKVDHKEFFQLLAYTLEHYLWEKYPEFDPNMVFEYVLNNNQLTVSYKSKLIEKYIRVLAAEKDQINEDFALIVIKNLQIHQSLLSTNNEEEINKLIEKNFSINLQVINLFNSNDEQNTFISKSAFTNFIANINIENIVYCTAVSTKYKSFIEDNDLVMIIFNKISGLISAENFVDPDTFERRDIILSKFIELFSLFEDSKELQEKDVFESLIPQFITLFDQTQGWDQKHLIVNVLFHLNKKSEQTTNETINNKILQFFQQASTESILELLSNLSNLDKENILELHLHGFMNKFNEDINLLENIYKFANKNSKIEIIKYVISNSDDSGLALINNHRDELHERIEVIKHLLIKADTLHPNDRQGIYNFLSEEITTKDSIDVKIKSSDQIKTLLKAENDIDAQQIGLNFFQKATFLKLEKRRDICKDVIESLTQPGRIITGLDKNSLNAISSTFDKLQNLFKQQFISILFEMLRSEKDLDTVEISLSILEKLVGEIHYSNYEKDFNDLLDRLEDWEVTDIKKLILEKIVVFKLNKNVKEKEYWKKIMSLVKDIND